MSLSLAACQSTRTWSYTPEPRSSAAPTLDKVVVVIPFEDHRKNENSNLIGLYLIPLMPYGWADYETPEGPDRHITSGLWQFRPIDDMTRAVAQEVENARVFKEAFVGNRPSEGDYVLTGEIVETGYHGKVYSYCLSAYGPLLWYLGLPAAQVQNTFELRLKLSKNPSEPPLWSYTISGREENTSWIYVMKPDLLYDALLKNGMKEALPSLREAVRKLATNEAQANVAS
jgi:hypothetical protein